MINIVITAGGTVERIDEVRKIINTSTGQLASLICTEIIKFHNEEDVNIHYIMSTQAKKPEITTKKVIYYPVTDTQSVIDTIDEIFGQYKVHYFIHAMAVSDFTVSYTAQIDALASELATVIKSDLGKNIEEKIKCILENPKSILEKDQKISSQKDVLVGLKRTPKVISLIKEYDKDVFLVGFKLLDHVSSGRLIEVATKLGEDNQCSLVLANDLKDINDKNHKAILLKKGMVKANFTTKEEIAKGLVETMFGSVMDQ